jgi:hypothetical protein
MKKYLISLIAMLLLPLASAQAQFFSTNGDTIRHQFGINVTQLVANLVRIGSSNVNIIDTSPYTFTYKYSPKPNAALRLGLGVDLNLRNSIDTFSTDNNSTYDIAFRIGYEKQKVFKNAWTFSYGIDAIGGISHSKTETIDQFGFNTTTTISNWYSGIAPMLGVAWHINQHISLSTETAWQFRYRNENIHTKSFGGFAGFFETEQNNRITETSFLPPLFLSVDLRF